MIYYASGFWKREDNGYFYYTDVSIMKSQYRLFQSIIRKFQSRGKLLSEHCTHSFSKNTSYIIQIRKDECFSIDEKTIRIDV